MFVTRADAFVGFRNVTQQRRVMHVPKQRRRTMSATNDVNVRRTVSDTVTGAAETLLMSPGRTDGESQKQRGPYRIEDWGKTWMNPNKARVLARVPAIAMPDIAGYWPHTTRPVRGPQEYAKRIIDLLDFISSTRPTRTSCSFAGSPEAWARRARSKRSAWID